jgi:CheY-like chemotaxis protein
MLAGSQPLASPPEPPDVLGLRVLVVDDNQTQREILKEMLTNWRMRPSTVESTPKALDELHLAAGAGSPYGIVLIDATMPPPDGFALAEEINKEPGLASSIVMMLTPTGRAVNAERCREIGAHGTVLKPIKQSELLDTLLSVASTGAGRRSATSGRARSEAEEPAALPPLRLLLAEDSVVNQRLAVRILEKAGHRVTVANNGLQALDALKREPFDLVLMDVQMPEMGGYEATQRIRADEKETGRHTPIIALTAHAMKGDRERCLQVGMDGYVAKPIRARDLFSTLEQVLLTHAPDLLTGERIPRLVEASGIAVETNPMPDEFDRAAALERCGDDPALLRELIEMFRSEIISWMRDLQSAVVSGNAEQVKRLAHTIKGAVGTFAATPAYEAAQRMEVIGKEGNLTEAPALLQEMQTVMDRLSKALAACEL